ncbi:MAG: hypothetical protein ACYC40_01835 [Patescibacteria group bacterium]
MNDLHSMSFNKLSLALIWKVFAKWLWWGLVVALVGAVLCWLDGVATFAKCLKVILIGIWSVELLVIAFFYLGLVTIKRKYTFYSQKFQVKAAVLYNYIKDEMITFEDMDKMTPAEFKTKIEQENKLKARYPSCLERRLVKSLAEKKKAGQ